MKRLAGLFILCTVVFSSAAYANKPLKPEQVPDLLKPWIPWVTQELPERACPFRFDSFDTRQCLWPTALSLDLKAQHGSFSVNWQVFKEDWISLPGDDKHWPLNVTANDKPAVVLNKNGTPAIKLLPGSYQIKGEFLWDSIPDNLGFPDDTGLINLKINDAAINAPTIKDGELWLKESDRGQAKPENVQNRLDVQIFRKITDDVPMQVATHLDLEVSGEQREAVLTNTVLSGFIPLEMQSPLPARLEPDGKLTVQLRPGRWQLNIISRATKDMPALELPKDIENEEIWVFDARPDLRVAEIEQLNTVDASQTQLPDDWKNLPAYKVPPGQSMGFKTIRRGDPEPEPNQLNLSRKLWLDFDGEGYTVNDSISGTMTRGWRLNALPETKLGKLTLDGDSQLITEQQGTHKQGVEVRKGQLNLNADSRMTGAIDTLSAVGWEQNFHQINAELNLPPGWRLLAATGVDNVPDSWIARWTLLDLFMVLITAYATKMLWTRGWGALALVTLVLIWHEDGAPHYVWLNILAATVLLRNLPQGKFFTCIKWYRYVSWAALAFIAVPFMVSQVRIGIYPQLEKPWQDIHAGVLQYGQSVSMGGGQMANLPASAPVMAPPPAPMQAQQNEGMAALESKSNDGYDRVHATLRKKARRLEKTMMPQSVEEKVQNEQDSYFSSSSSNFQRIDPKAKIQTGPGLPQWEWHKVYLSWNGAVDSAQTLSLWYLPPTLTTALNFVRVLLIAVLAALMFGLADKIRPNYKSVLRLGLWLLLLPALYVPSPDAFADNFPNDALLEQLKTKLYDQVIPDCVPECAHIEQMHVAITAKDLAVTLKIHAQESVSLPLPAEYQQWFPNEVLDNGKPATALYRSENQLWINLSAGGHQVVLRGVAPLLSKFTLPMPLKPNRVTVEKSEWEVVGLQEDGLADEQLQFSRTQHVKANEPKTTLEPVSLPPFVQVERTLQLGLDWRVVTRVLRLSPADSAVVLKVPLLKGEGVTSQGIHVKDNAVEVSMAAAQTQMQWESALDKTDSIELTAASTDQWIEVWKADVSPVWHIEPSGLTMIHLNSQGQWLPEWHPWPGEKMTLAITRPEAVVGKTLTIDSSTLRTTQGQRTREVVLSASFRSSQGQQHTLTLPENAQLQSVVINGQSQALRMEGRKLTLPVNPGSQNFVITWQEPTAISPWLTSSSVDMGQESVNSNHILSLGHDRWVLWVKGPKFGPIILFWGELVVIVLVSLGLGRFKAVPLKHWHWFLLLLGLSQVPMESVALVIAWFALMAWRTKQTMDTNRHFNFVQIVLGVLTLTALGVLFAAVAQGLLSAPDMRITGNQSSSYVLNWYQDRSPATLPVVNVLTLPLMVYRLLMLAWSLWLAVSLLNWLKWGWQCFTSNGLWQKAVPKAKVAEEIETVETSEP